MRPILLVLGIALAGCVHVSQEPLVGVSVNPLPNSCLDPLVGSDALISIGNGSSQKVAFRAYGKSGPPFVLYPGAFQVLVAEPLTQDFAPWGVVLDEFMPSSHEITLGPGDTTEFVVSPSHWPSPENREVFKLEVRDTSYRPYLSEALHVCQPHSAPNNSFKPNPLRGSA